MCGIVGIWQRDGRALDLGALHAATDALRHRGPDDEGYLLVHTPSGRAVSCGGSRTAAGLGLPPLEACRGESFDLGLGFRRLAVLDPSPAGHQPMASPDGRLWIVFNGEIYNFLELREELERHGFEFRTRSDTEVILAAFRCWGEDCVQRFVGMWAMMIWDSEARRLFVSRDRFGIKPLYLAETPGRFACASEIKALVGPHGIPFAPEESAVFDFLAAGELPSPEGGGTFFRGVHALPAAHDLVVEAAGSRRRRYWDIPAAREEPRPWAAERAIEGYRELFADAVRLHLRSDVALGTCLSGGVDSSAIVCVMNRLITAGGTPPEAIGARQKTFSAVYGDGGRHDETSSIDRVVSATGVHSHRTVPSAERLRADLDRLVWHQDEPFPTTSIFAQWCVMDLVHDHGVTVLLDGQGADEVLAGYRPYRLYLADVLRRHGPGRAIAAAGAIQSRAGQSAAGLLAAALLYQLPTGWIGRLRGQHQRSRRAFDVLDRGLRARHAGAQRAGVPVAPTLDAHLRAQVREESLPHLLRYEDRNSMAFGVEARVPFLDHRLVEFSFAEGAPGRIHDGWTKWILRCAMNGWAPAEVVWRRDKVGFETPEAGWLREWLRAEPALFRDEALVRPYLDPVAARRAAAAWAAGGDRQPPPLWRWINLEAWLRVWHSAGGAPGRG